MYRVILAGNHQEAVAYARSQGWRSGAYRIATRAATIRGLRVAEVHELPSFATRLDRHAVMGELRYARNIQHFLIDETQDWPANYPDPDQGALDFGWAPLVAEAPADEEEGDDLARLDSDYDVEAKPKVKAGDRIGKSASPYEPIGAFAI